MPLNATLLGSRQSGLEAGGSRSDHHRLGMWSPHRTYFAFRDDVLTG